MYSLLVSNHNFRVVFQSDKMARTMVRACARLDSRYIVLYLKKRHNFFPKLSFSPKFCPIEGFYVFLVKQDTSLSHCLSTQVYKWIPASELMLGGWGGGWGVRGNTPSRIIPKKRQKPEIGIGPMGHVTRMNKVG